MSSSYLPSSKAALSLPESPPTFMLQASIPRLGFNGHKPISFIEGEGQLKESVINKKHKASMPCSLIHEMAHMLLMPEAATSPKAPSHSPCLSCRPLDTAGPKRCLESMDTINVGMLIQQMEQMMEGSFLLEPPPAVHHSHLWDDRDFELDRWLHWKPPDLEESRWSADVVRLRDNGMSSSYSPRPEAPHLLPAFEPATLPVPVGYSLTKTELVPPAQQRLVPPVVVGWSSEPSPTCCHVLLGPKPDRRLHWKPPKLKGS